MVKEQAAIDLMVGVDANLKSQPPVTESEVRVRSWVSRTLGTPSHCHSTRNTRGRMNEKGLRSI